MKDISLKQMRYAIALAQSEHFGRAAEKSNISQPALSQQIKLLEDGCKTPIFERIGKTSRLTPFGQEFIERAQKIVKDADDLVNFTQSITGFPSYPIRFGLIPTVAPYLLPDIYPALRQDLPDLDLVISEGQTEHLLKQMENGDLDIALIATEMSAHSNLFSKPLFADPFVLATNLQAQMAPQVILSELPQDTILLLEDGHCLRDQAIDACALQGPKATRAFAATSLSTIVEFVATGQGVTLLPTISLKKETANRNIKIHRLAAPGASRNLQLVWRTTSPFHQTYLEIAKSIRAAGQASLETSIPKV